MAATLTFAELRETLRVGKARLMALDREGMPSKGKGKAKRYDLSAVNAWLVAKGYAKPAQTICRTYQDLSEALGVPVRTIASWVNKPGFPGTPGTPGRRDAELPVDDIRAWCEANTAGGNGGGFGTDHELLEIQRRLHLLKLESAERDELVALQRLANVDELIAFAEQVVANAVSVLQPIPDIVLQRLPRIKAADKRIIHAELVQIVDTALEEISRIVTGDDDETDDDATDDDETDTKTRKATR